MIERRHGLAAEFCILFKNGFHGFRRRVFAMGQCVDFRQSCQFVHDEQHIFHWCDVAHLRLLIPCVLKYAISCCAQRFCNFCNASLTLLKLFGPVKLAGPFFLDQPSCLTNSGTTSNKSPTIESAATEKIGASSSLLIATITLESFIPAKCWIAPEIPTAIYSCGATILPV